MTPDRNPRPFLVYVSFARLGLGLLHTLLGLEDRNGRLGSLGLRHGGLGRLGLDLFGGGSLNLGRLDLGSGSLGLGRNLDLLRHRLGLGVLDLPGVALARAGVVADGLARERGETLGDHLLDIGRRELGTLGLDGRLGIGRLDSLGRLGRIGLGGRDLGGLGRLGDLGLGGLVGGLGGRGGLGGLGGHVVFPLLWIFGLAFLATLPVADEIIIIRKVPKVNKKFKKCEKSC